MHPSRSSSTAAFAAAGLLAACVWIQIVEAEGVIPLDSPTALVSDNSKTGQVALRVYEAIQKQAHHLLGKVHPWEQDDSLLLLTESKSGEHWIRPNTGTIAGLSFLYRFGPYDENTVGVSRSELLNGTIVPMMRYVVVTHLTGTRSTSDGKPWGDAWQSAHWAHMLGRAAWWIWDDLPTDIHEGVRRVVVHEASRFVDAEPPYQIQLDTKAEENAWNSQIFSVAMLLHPNHSQRGAWETAFQKWAISSFLRQADEDSETLVDGRPISEQFHGANIYDDFTLENHRIVHPDYMTTFSLSLGNRLDFDMTGRRAPEALLYNVAGIYENLKWFSLPDGGFVYPSGQDWRLFRNPDWCFTHLLMAVYGEDPDAWTLAMRCIDALEKMQARSTNGAVYQDGEYYFPSTQSDIIHSLSRSWLLLQRAEEIVDNHSERRGVRRLDSGKIILNRTPTFVHTFSWGKTIMAQCVPYRLDRIVSPHLRNGVGHIRLRDSKDILPVNLHDVSVEESDDGFTVDLIVDHGEGQVRAFLRYESRPDGTWRWREKLTALSDITTGEIATGLIGILNNPQWVYESGQRSVLMDEVEEIVPSMSGETIQSAAVRRVLVDQCLEIQSASPMHVKYIAATKPERGRLTDCLVLNHRKEERVWRKGDTLSEFDVTVRCVID